MKMNVPAKFEMKVFIKNEKTGQTGEANVSLGMFDYPSEKKIREAFKTLAEELKENAPGFELCSKADCLEQATGIRVAVPGKKEWDL